MATENLIPTVKVPMNFGIEYLGASAHGNLSFTFDDEEVLHANSAIVSFNSPVVKRLTLESSQTTIDVREFSKEAVKCCLKAAYTGAVHLSKNIFRDVNKFAYAFEIAWLVTKCFEYFTLLVGMITGDDFKEQQFLFDEGMYILEKIKTNTYINMVVAKLTSFSTGSLRSFLTSYLRELPLCKPRTLEVLIEMVSNGREHLLVEVLVKNFEAGTIKLDPNSRLILKELNFISCSDPEHEHLYRRLMDMLENVENPSKEDFKSIVKIFRQSSIATKKGPYAPIPNLFHFKLEDLEKIANLDELITALIGNSKVGDLHVFLDGFSYWYSQVFDGSPEELQPVADRISERIANHVQKCGWHPIPANYCLQSAVNSAILGSDSFQELAKNPTFTSTGEQHRVESVKEYSPEELFARSHEIPFNFKHKSKQNCRKVGECGFIIAVKAATGANDSSFNMDLVIEPSFYGVKTHFHRETLLLAEKIYFTLDITTKNSAGEVSTWPDCPVTWSERPRAVQYKRSTHWHWGKHFFWKQGTHELFLKGGLAPKFKEYTCYGSSAKIRPVVYFAS